MNFEATFRQLGDKLSAWGRALLLGLPNLALALLVLTLAVLLSRLVARLVVRGVRRVSGHASLTELVGKIARYAVVVAGFVVALQILHLDKAATTFLAGAGILGLAAGFAFQDLTANFIAGVALALRRPMEVGEIVETNGQRGVVHAIHLRSTVLRTFEGQLVRIPNRKVFEEILVNFSETGERRVSIPIGVSYAEDLALVRKVAIEAVSGVDRLPDREVELFYDAFGDSAITLELRFWIGYRSEADHLRARSEAIERIKRAFDAHGITIPFPIRTLDFGVRGGEPLREQLRAAGDGQR